MAAMEPSHQQDGHDNGRQRRRPPGSLPNSATQFLVCPGRFAVACLIARFYLLPIFGEEVAHKQGNDGAQRTHAHNEQQVVADAQRAGRGNGPTVGGMNT